MQILLVEDEPHVRTALSRHLRAWGFEVMEAGTIEEAEAALDRRVPAVAVIDVNLPDGTGWHVLRSMRDRGLTGVRAIVMSAIPPSTARLHEFRPYGVLLKPFPGESLRQLVSRACEDRSKEHTDDG